MNKLTHYLRSVIARWTMTWEDRVLADETDCADLERRMHKLDRVCSRFLP